MAPATSDPQYERFLAALGEWERAEPPVRSRGPEKLAGIRALLGKLGNPESGPLVVHVAGTNGKGMTATMIEALLRKEGVFTGLYTSPHLVDMRERIRLNGEPVERERIARVGTDVLALAAGMADRVSYFDVLTAIGFQVFRDAGVAWVVLEVGLGGASDATNVTGKQLAVLTRIGLDHQTILGEEPRAIAEQKLGILRPGVPVVVAPQSPDLAGWIPARAKELGSPVLPVEPILWDSNPDSHPGGGGGIRWRDVSLAGGGWSPSRVTAPRLQCAATALAAVEALFPAADLVEREERLRAALSTPMPGRLDLWEEVVLPDGKRLARMVLDGAHNAQALLALALQLELWQVWDFTLILSLQRDKLTLRVGGALARLAERSAAILLPDSHQSRTATPPEVVQLVAESLTGGPEEMPPWQAVPDLAGALALAAGEPERPCVATGSLWMVGRLIGLLEAGEKWTAPRGKTGAGPSTSISKEN